MQIMDIHLYNTLTKKKESFSPIQEGQVGIYSCGPTVYNYAHIGNLRAYVFADILKRTFLFNEYNVNHVMNITDVGHLTSDADEGEDKIEKGAKREGKTVWQIAEFYTEQFLKDTSDMNIITPNIISKATDHIKEMIEFIQRIEKNGYTYVSNGNVYFDTSKLKDYGKLIGSKQTEENKKSRVGRDSSKKNQSDFVLWFTKHKHGDHAMIWDSPWGEGFPGWHIECSAMSTKYLGEHIDIHTGGTDHIPIHHTNEIAQCEGAFVHDSVRTWMHSAFLIMGEGKMSKSTGDFLRLQVLLEKGYSSDDYRYFLLNTHYRKRINFSYESLDAAKTALRKAKSRVKEILAASDEFDDKKYQKYLERFNKEINDDLNTPKCLATMWSVLNNEKLSSKTKLELILKFDKVLGLRLSEITADDEIPADILELKDERDRARNAKEWKKSDELRDLLAKKGYRVFDNKDGSEIKRN
jgi:cysteinyl-tRNA synthetase